MASACTPKPHYCCARAHVLPPMCSRRGRSVTVYRNKGFGQFEVDTASPVAIDSGARANAVAIGDLVRGAA